MKIELQGHTPRDILTNIAAAYGAKLEGSLLTIDHPHTQGSIQLLELDRHTTLLTSELVHFEELLMEHPALLGLEFIPIVCVPSRVDILQRSNGLETHLGKYEQAGIMMASTQKQFQALVPPHVRVREVVVAVHRSALLELMRTAGKHDLAKHLEADPNFVLYQSFDLQLLNLVEELFNLSRSEEANALVLLGKCYQFLGELVERLDQPERTQTPINLSHQDIELLFEIKERLEHNLETPPNLEELARDFALSTSKLQRAFKQVFGDSVYQYVMKCRMERARELLETNRYTVAEVGYRLGYSNLSHFAAAFKRYWGQTPKRYLQDTRLLA